MTCKDTLYIPFGWLCITIPLMKDRSSFLHVEAAPEVTKKAQKEKATKRKEQTRKHLKNVLNDEKWAIVVSGSGKGAGAFTQAPLNEKCVMSNDHFVAAVRRKLLDSNPAGAHITHAITSRAEENTTRQH